MRMETTVNGRVLELCRGDITRQQADVIVNAANSRLAGGGGVDGAIHRAGGPEIMQECRKIGGCPTGSAVITTAGNLPAQYVVHTVGPVYRDGVSGEPELLRSAYLGSLQLADANDAKSVAFPSISTGVYGYPVADAARIALGAAVEYLEAGGGIERVVFVLFSEQDYAVYCEVLAGLAGAKAGH